MRTLLSSLPFSKRSLMVLSAAGLLLASCGPKAPPAASADAASSAAPAPPPTPATPPAATPAPVEAQPETPAAPVANVDLRVTVGRADGTKKSGHVKRIERSTDWFGEADWTIESEKLLILGENAGKESRLAWKDIRSLTVTPGKPADDTDCSYDSNFTPWMYDCTLRTTCKATGTDGKTYEVTSREKWRFTFDDDSSVEFWLVKYPSREQDEGTARVEDEVNENYAMYEKLQARLRTEIKTMVTSISVAP